MKTQILILSIISCSICAKAQVVFNSNNLPAVNTTVYNAVDTLSSAQPGTAGANSNWDFSAIRNQRQETISYVPPAGIPYAPEFPNADMVQKTKQQQYLFYQTTVGGLKQLGISGDLYGFGLNTAAKYKPVRLLQKTPFNFNDSYMDSTGYTATSYVGQQAGSVYIDSIRAKNTTISTTVYDGYGTLKTVIKTYPSVGRLKTHVKSTDSTAVYISATLGGPGQWQLIQGTTTETDNYTWFTSNLKAPIVAITIDDKGKTISTNYLLDAKTAIASISKSATINIFPNPATDELNIDYANNSDALLAIYNSLGQLITQRPVTANSIAKLNVSNYAAGIYTYRLTDKSDEMPIGTGRFCVVR